MPCWAPYTLEDILELTNQWTRNLPYPLDILLFEVINVLV